MKLPPAKKAKVVAKPAKKPTKNAKTNKISLKKPVKKEKTLADIIQSWDADQGPLPTLYDTATQFDEVCNRLVEIRHLMDAALEDTFGIENERTITLFLLVERMVKELVEKTDGLTSELYRINRAQQSK